MCCQDSGATYFDQREGRVKPIPDCQRIGLVWTGQRCERLGFWDQFMSTLRQAKPVGLGFLESEDYQEDYWDAFGGGIGLDGSGGSANYYTDGDGNYWDDYGNAWDDAGNYYGANGDYFPADDNISYFENADGSWEYTDQYGNVYTGGADGSLYQYDAATGEEIFISASGEYSWVNAAGDSYTIDAQGNWTSTGADGLVCYGDAAGNGGCTDGTQYSANSGRPNPIRNAAEAARSALGGGSAGGGNPAQAAKQQAQQAAQRAAAGLAPTQPGVFSKQDIKTLTYVGLGFAALVVLGGMKK